MKKNKKIGLALGGGGARGCAHIGVIKALEEAGIPIDFVAGTSIGALVGGIYAKDKIGVLEFILLQVKWKDIVKNFDPVIPQKGLFECKKVVKLLEKIIEENNFRNLKVPFTAVATDLLTGEEVHINKGNIIDAIRASIAVPGIITPMKIKNRYLVDGGVTNPLPVDVVRNMGADIIIGVDLNRSFLKRKKFARQDFSKNKLVKWIVPSPNILDVIESSIFTMQDQLTQKNLKVNQPEFLIQPELGSTGIFDFHKAKQLIKIGYDEAQLIIPKLKKML